jgi:hypothetical protein
MNEKDVLWFIMALLTIGMIVGGIIGSALTWLIL